MQKLLIAFIFLTIVIHTQEIHQSYALAKAFIYKGLGCFVLIPMLLLRKKNT